MLKIDSVAQISGGFDVSAIVKGESVLVRFQEDGPSAFLFAGIMGVDEDKLSFEEKTQLEQDFAFHMFG